jgi:hypothetical protein
MTAKEAMAHPWLASVRDLSAKRHAEEDEERRVLAAAYAATLEGKGSGSSATPSS